MPGTLTRLLYHIVFGTKGPMNLFAADLQSRLHVRHQAAHHRQRGFVEELKALLDAHGIDCDDRYSRE